jgi:hypothetical protein
MRIVVTGRVLDLNQGKNGVSYVKFLDTDIGGQFQLAIPGGETIKIDQKIALDVEVKPGIGQYGMYLKVVRVNSSESNEKGDK